MSSEAAAWAVDQVAEPPLAKLILMLMADEADASHAYNFGLQRLAGVTGARPGKIENAILALEARQLISRAGAGWTLAVANGVRERP